jgi:hypothetical protein
VRGIGSDPEESYAWSRIRRSTLLVRPVAMLGITPSGLPAGDQRTRPHREGLEALGGAWLCGIKDDLGRKRAARAGDLEGDEPDIGLCDVIRTGPQHAGPEGSVTSRATIDSQARVWGLRSCV